MAIRPWWDALLGRILSNGSELPLQGALNLISPLGASNNPATGAVDIQVDAELLNTLVSESVAAANTIFVTVPLDGSYEITQDSWGGGIDTARSRLVLFVEGVSTVYMPDDASRQQGARVRICIKGPGALITVDPQSANIQFTSGGSVGGGVETFTVDSGEATVEYVWSGTAWVTDFAPRDGGFVEPGEIRASGFSLVAKPATSSGAASSLVIGTNALPMRAGSGDLASTSIGASQVLARLESGDAGPKAINELGYLIENARSSSYTLVAGDAGKLISIDSPGIAVDLTVPPNASVAFPIGTVIYVAQYGTGQITLVAGSGVTIRVAASKGLKIAEQWEIVMLVKKATNEWVATGNLVA